MKAWFKRMSPKLKNWRWWLLLPLILLLTVVVLLPIKLIQKIGELVTRFGDALYDNFNYKQTWLSKLIEWSEEVE